MVRLSIEPCQSQSTRYKSQAWLRRYWACALSSRSWRHLERRTVNDPIYRQNFVHMLLSSPSTAQIQLVLNPSSMQRLISAFNMSCLDYCNAMLAGLPACTLAPLQHVLNARLALWSVLQQETASATSCGHCTGCRSNIVYVTSCVYWCMPSKMALARLTLWT